MKNKEKNKIKVQKTSRFPKLYIIDAVIILLLIAIGCGIYFRFNTFDWISSLRNKTNFEVSFTIKNVEYDTIERVVDINDSVYFKDSGESFGVIIGNNEDATGAFSSSEATENFYFYDSEGIYRENIVFYPINTRVDLYGKLQCKGNINEGFYAVNGTTPISKGETYIVCTENATFQIIIDEIKELKA